MKKYAPRKVFVLEDGKYIELTNEEFENRKENNSTYGDRHFIPVQGFLLEVDRRNYEDFYREKERQAYLNKLDAKYGLLSIDAFDSEDDNGSDYIQSESENITETVAQLLLRDKLRTVIPTLKQVDRELLWAIYYEGLTERQYADRCGVNRNAIHKRKVRILAQIRKILEN